MKNVKSAAFPVKISPNHRYFVDQNDQPFFYHADTSWKLFWELNLEEAEIYLEDRRQKGFSVIQIQLLPHRDYQANRNGDTPFLVRGDLTTPNPAYFEHVDKVINIAMDKGLGVFISPIWASRWEQDWFKHLNTDNAVFYSRYIANRYKDFKNIIGWIHGGDDDAVEIHDAIRLCAQTFKEVVPSQLHSFHALVKGGWVFFNEDKWYDFHMAYAYEYADIIDQLKAAYQLNPVRPVFLSETHYELSPGIPSASIRKFAYASVILGGAGQTFGHKDIWGASYYWKEAMKSMLSHHMMHLQQFFKNIPWHELVPEENHSLVTDGYGGIAELAITTSVADGSLAVIYIPTKRTFTVEMSKLSPHVKAYWFDPTSGLFTDPGSRDEQQAGKFTTPGINSNGDEDWVLLFKDVND